MLFAMQTTKPNIPAALKSDEAKRTTIILERSEREYIEQLIKDGKEPGIKPLISKMLSIYKNLNIDDWQFPGEYYCGISRIAIVNVEMINIITQFVPKDKWYEVGKRMGDALKVSIQSTIGLDPQKKENWEQIFRRLKVQGLGDLYLRDKFVLIKTPVINDAEIWQGMLEDLLGIELEVRNPMVPLVFEIKQPKTATD
jgi:hypothetical protein